MPKVPRVYFNTNFYELGEVKFQKGYHYPVTDETKTRVLAGDAEMRQVEMDLETAKTEQAAANEELSTERAATLLAEVESAGKGRGE